MSRHVIQCHVLPKRPFSTQLLTCNKSKRYLLATDFHLILVSCHGVVPLCYSNGTEVDYAVPSCSCLAE